MAKKDSVLKELVEASFISEAEKERILGVCKQEGQEAAMAAFDAAAALELKSRIGRYEQGASALDTTVATLAAELQERQDALEKELIETLEDIPEEAMRERDAAWDAYYQKCDEARAEHERKARKAIGGIAAAA